MEKHSRREVRKLSLKEFLSEGDAPRVEAGDPFNGGAFMCCHTHIFAETGVWIEELVPVFQKLDAHLAASAEKTVAQLAG